MDIALYSSPVAARDAMSESCAGSAVFSPAPGSSSPLHLRPESTRTNTVRNSSVEPMSNSNELYLLVAVIFQCLKLFFFSFRESQYFRC